MTAYFFDSSALVKRYVSETGSIWVDGVFTEPSSNTVFIAEVTLVEIGAAFARRVRDRAVEGQSMDWIKFRSLLISHLSEYEITPLDREIVNGAMEAAFRHSLRAYDAVQLWSALLIQERLRLQGLLPLTFVSSDKDLLQAAATPEYQFQIVDPNTL